MNATPTEDLELSAARALLAGLPERVQEDISAAFEPAILAACVTLRNKALPEFIALEARLRSVAGFPKGQFRDAVRNLGRGGARQSVPPGANGSSSNGAAKKWQSLLTHDAQNRVDGTEANIVTTLVHAPEWKGVLAFNAFANNVVSRKPPPWFPDDLAAGGSKAGEWEDDDDGRLVCWLQRALGMRVSVTTALSALQIVARRYPFHPVRDYLDSLKWDGVARLPTWLRKYAGATEQPAEYTARVGTWFLVSGVARIYEPGCQAHHCIILEGAQGKGKSTLVRQLVARPEWFSEHNANLVDKDAYAILQGRWLLELAELDSVARADLGRIKRYMTQAVDKYRPVWARRVASFPRHCVFMGTVNDSDYLRDPSGNRRFWPVAVKTVNTDAIARDRDQLWAEAVHYYRTSARWWPYPDDERLLRNEQEERVLHDSWEAPVSLWVAEWQKQQDLRLPADRAEGLRPDELLSGAIRLDLGQQEERHLMRLGRVMARLQWRRRRLRSANPDPNDVDGEGNTRRVYVYQPPLSKE